MHIFHPRASFYGLPHELRCIIFEHAVDGLLPHDNDYTALEDFRRTLLTLRLISKRFKVDDPIFMELSVKARILYHDIGLNLWKVQQHIMSAAQYMTVRQFGILPGDTAARNCIQMAFPSLGEIVVDVGRISLLQSNPSPARAILNSVHQLILSSLIPIPHKHCTRLKILAHCFTRRSHDVVGLGLIPLHWEPSIEYVTLRLEHHRGEGWIEIERSLTGHIHEPPRYPKLGWIVRTSIFLKRKLRGSMNSFWVRNHQLDVHHVHETLTTFDYANIIGSWKCYCGLLRPYVLLKWYLGREKELRGRLLKHTPEFSEYKCKRSGSNRPQFVTGTPSALDLLAFLLASD